MEASISRSFMKCTTNRHFLNPLLLSNSISKRHLFPHPSPTLLLPISQHTPLSFSNPNSHSPNHFPKLNPSSLSTSTSFQSNSNLNTPLSINRFARILSGHNDKSFEWKFAIDGVNGRELGFVYEDKRPIVTVVLLGWLGSKQKHLRRYAELYNLFGMDAVTFSASVFDVLGFDLGRKLEARIAALTDELVSWLEGKEKNGRERFLIFHTFSNTGWLAYGSILNRLQDRPELLEKIKGCVVDSGGDPELDPKVWAAGFSTAMLKKQSSAVNSFSEINEIQNKATNGNTYEKEPMFIEVLLLTFFEKFFTYLLEFPDINKRLTKITSTLEKNQRCYPQLYLYSSADKVIPSQKIESFADLQKKLGKNVTKFNFKSTPHVDHYRTFPDTYRSLIQDFLNQCFAAEDGIRAVLKSIDPSIMTGNEGDKGGSSVIDFTSPYYLHPSDSPKQPSVNEVLTDGNYSDWVREMINFLLAKNKTDFVDGTLRKPEISSPEYKPWMRCDAMIKGWLTTSMEKGIRDSVKYANTSSEIWSDLKERFGKESAPRAYELKQKIVATRQEGSSVSTYYTRLRSLWDESHSIFAFPCCSCNKCTCELGKKITAHLDV